VNSAGYLGRTPVFPEPVPPTLKRELDLTSPPWTAGLRPCWMSRLTTGSAKCSPHHRLTLLRLGPALFFCIRLPALDSSSHCVQAPGSTRVLDSLGPKLPHLEVRVGPRTCHPSSLRGGSLLRVCRSPPFHSPPQRPQPQPHPRAGLSLPSVLPCHRIPPLHLHPRCRSEDAGAERAGVQSGRVRVALAALGRARCRWMSACPRPGPNPGGRGVQAPPPAPPHARSQSAGRLGSEQKPGPRGLSAARAGMRARLRPPLPGLGAARPHGR
jgi:hypothetical protein